MGGTYVNVWFIPKGLRLGEYAVVTPEEPPAVGSFRPPLVALTVITTAAALAAGCDGNTTSPAGRGAGSTPTAGGQSAATMVRTASTKFGTILVDDGGRTLYLFEKDQPNQSACSGACAVDWPVYHSKGTPNAGSGVHASLLGTITRSDNTTQVTYNSHPLYYYSDDNGMPRQFKGQNVNAFGARWYVVAPTGGKVEGA
jgi:predicted lipoprotein with Yx(FWY)xxD motif